MNAWPTSGETALISEYKKSSRLLANRSRAVIMAVHTQRHECTKLLLAAGADPNASDNSGNTALIHAGEVGCCDMVCTLMSSGAILNHTAEDGETALGRAVRLGKDQCIQHLLLAGARLAEGHQLLVQTPGDSFFAVAKLFSLVGASHVSGPPGYMISFSQRTLTLTFDRSLKSACRQAIRRHLLIVNSAELGCFYCHSLQSAVRDAFAWERCLARTIPHVGLPTSLKDYVIDSGFRAC